MYCQNCGNIITSDSSFCVHCGFPTPNMVQQSEGKITVVRPKKIWGFAIPFDVFVGNSFVGKLKNNSSVFCNVPLGEHAVILKSTEKDVIQTVTINQNQKEVILEVVPTLGLIAAKPKITNIQYR